MGPPAGWQRRAASGEMKGTPRIVLDTNVVLSALVFRKGHLDALRDSWRAKRFVPLVSQTTAAELIRALA